MVLLKSLVTLAPLILDLLLFSLLLFSFLFPLVLIPLLFLPVLEHSAVVAEDLPPPTEKNRAEVEVTMRFR